MITLLVSPNKNNKEVTPSVIFFKINGNLDTESRTSSELQESCLLNEAIFGLRPHIQ